MWRYSMIRMYLEDEDKYFSKFFTPEEAARVLTVRTKTPSNPICNTGEGEVTTDKLFILSIQEAEKYFRSDDDRRCRPTDNIVDDGCPDEYTCEWWLRTPGMKQGIAAYVTRDGRIDCGGCYAGDIIDPSAEFTHLSKKANPDRYKAMWLDISP